MAYEEEKKKLRAKLRAGNAANFIKAIDNAGSEKIDTVIMMVDAFHSEPDLLYIALTYASLSGVTVTMAPRSNSASSVKQK